jgi:hypothetical protein
VRLLAEMAAGGESETAVAQKKTPVPPVRDTTTTRGKCREIVRRLSFETGWSPQGIWTAAYDSLVQEAGFESKEASKEAGYTSRLAWMEAIGQIDLIHEALTCLVSRVRAVAIPANLLRMGA